MKNNLFIVKRTKMEGEMNGNDDSQPTWMYYGVYHLPINKDNMRDRVTNKIKGPL